MAERYASGSSLDRTNKEFWIDKLEETLGADFSDEFYCALKKLTLAEIKELKSHIMELIRYVREEEKSDR